MRDPFTEIREALAHPIHGDIGGRLAQVNAALIALERLEREAAERETALADLQSELEATRTEWDARARLHLLWQERAEKAEARVREVEAERDAWEIEAGENAGWAASYVESQATVARLTKELEARDIEPRFWAAVERGAAEPPYCPECGAVAHGAPCKGISHRRGCAALPAVDGSSASSTEPLGSYAPPEPTT